MILAPNPYDCAELLTWQAEWHVDCIINFVFHFFKGTHGICAYFLKKIKKFVKIYKKNSGIFFITKNIFQNFEIYIFSKIPKFINYEKYIF